jgi:type I restriction enzyme S subunit
MNLKYKKYDNYKPSGIEWLGDMPEHWEQKRVKFVIDYQKGKNPNDLTLTETENIYLSMEYLRGKNDNISYIDNTKGLVKIDNNDILLLWDGSNAGEFIQGKKGILSSTMALIKSKANKEFSWYYFKVLERKLKESTIGMGIPHVSGLELKNLSFLIPPKQEQTAIANFLDRKTAQIDKAIAQKEQLIELLKERRQILIHEAVTQGLDKSVEMKDSGVEWIGDVPKHWGVSKAKLYSEVFVPERSKPILNTTKDGLPWITTHLLRKEKIKLSDVKYFVSYRAQRQAGSRKINAENIIATCVGTFGLSTKITFDCIINQQLQGYQKLRINANYLNLIIKISEDYFKNNATLTTIMYVNKDTFGNLPITIPPIKEQIEIANYIETQSQKIKTAISLKQQEIASLKEYKTVLIDAAVTGKVVVD